MFISLLGSTLGLIEYICVYLSILIASKLEFKDDYHFNKTLNISIKPLGVKHSTFCFGYKWLSSVVRGLKSSNQHAW